MTRIELAKTAGFCFGVDRAIKQVYQLLEEGRRVCTLGPVIHNPHVIAEFKQRGVRLIDSPEQVLPGEVVVIRTHGIPRSIVNHLQASGAEICDTTCPFVKKAHKIVSEQPRQGDLVWIAGDSRHPEVIGIVGHCNVPCSVFSDTRQLETLCAQKQTQNPANRILMLAQTTFSAKEWQKCLEILNLLYTNAIVFDTICSATQDRQSEAQALSARCDRMVVIGGRESSNTAKLKAVCAQNCPTLWVEDASTLCAADFDGCQTVGVTAGASTPAGIIKEVLIIMSELMNETLSPQESAGAEEKVEAVTQAATPEESAAETAPVPAQAKEEVPPDADLPIEITDDMDFSQALEESLKSMNSDQTVRGIVMGISPSEIQVDIGRKQTGYVPLDEYSADPGVNALQELKIGDEINLMIMKTNDMEGTVMLSKKRYDAIQAWTDIVAAEESGEILEGVVTDVIRGGILVLTRGVKVFIPASLATLSRNEPLDDLLHQTVQYRIIEINRGRKRAVGSVRAVAKDLRREAQEAFWAQAEVGAKFNGKVRSMTSYGAFVDIGGVDGMVHVSELSWKRVKQPSDVLSIGDEIEVYIKALDPETKRISLGYKKTEDNPWEILHRDYPVDSVVEAEVVGMTAFGAFARVIPGVDGLIHISQIADRHIEKPQDALKIGETVTVKITGIDFDKKRVSLSIRALLDPMETDGETETDVETAEEVVVESGQAE